MLVEIIVSRAAYPIVGAVVDLPESVAQGLIDSGLAKLADKKPAKKTTKAVKPTEKPLADEE